ncbi:hypothetical protein AcV7_005612 [Taiwanofungus camphoratus]|nr:hypothetical protein AcV7_005612 [Antrodia cinnamomea]
MRPHARHAAPRTHAARVCVRAQRPPPGARVLDTYADVPPCTRRRCAQRCLQRRTEEGRGACAEKGRDAEWTEGRRGCGGETVTGARRPRQIPGLTLTLKKKTQNSGKLKRPGGSGSLRCSRTARAAHQHGRRESVVASTRTVKGGGRGGGVGGGLQGEDRRPQAAHEDPDPDTTSTRGRERAQGRTALPASQRARRPYMRPPSGAPLRAQHAARARARARTA